MTKQTNLQKIIGAGESTIIEWKPSLAQTDDIIKTITAFANTEGGKIIVGVSDAGSLKGVAVGKATIENFTNKIHQKLDPMIHPKITTKKIEGKQIIIVAVKAAMDKAVLAFGRPYKRVGKSTVKMSKVEYERLILEKHKDKLQFDTQRCKKADLKDIDQKKVQAYLKLREKNRNMSSKIKIPLNQFLINVKAIEGKHPTNAGILFFGKEPLYFISHARLRLVRIKGVKIYGNILDRLDCEGTLWEMVDDGEDFIRKNIRLLGFRTDKSFRREDKFEYPIRALREAIINGLIHRDFFNPADVRVFIFDDRVEVVSPGPFPRGVTPKKPQHKPVNKILSELMYDIGYIEKYGSGIYLENELCLKNGNKKPVYEITPNQTTVIFKSQVEDVTVVELDETLMSQLNERQRKAMEYVKKEGGITRPIYCQINEIGETYAKKELNELIGKHILRRVGRGKSTHYTPVTE